MKTKLYLDVDGVLLAQESKNIPTTVLANHINEFLEFVLQNFDCYWLTTHCRNNSTRKNISDLINAKYILEEKIQNQGA